MITNPQVVDETVVETEELADVELSLDDLDMVGGGNIIVMY